MDIQGKENEVLDRMMRLMEDEMVSKDLFLECMRKVIGTIRTQGQMIERLVNDMNMRNHEGLLYLRGERMYNTQDLMDRLHICRRSISAYRKNGDLPYILLRNKAYYKEGDVVSLIHRFSDRLDRKAIERFLSEIDKKGDAVADR